MRRGIYCADTSDRIAFSLFGRRNRIWPSRFGVPFTGIPAIALEQGALRIAMRLTSVARAIPGHTSDPPSGGLRLGIGRWWGKL